jgi:hypothetical protein
MSPAGRGIESQAGRSSPQARLAVAAGFALVLITVSVAVIREFVIEPNQTVIILPPEVTQQAQAVAQPPRVIGPLSPAGSRPTFHGTVVDAITGEPIPSFQVRLGYSYVYPNNSQSGDHPQNYLPIPTRVYHGGQYTLTSQFQLGPQAVWFVRVEARGHMPMISAAQHGSATLDFKLSPGKDVEGVVLDAGGSPVAGATVLLAYAGMYAQIDPTAPPTQGQQDQLNTVTSPDGRYTFPPQNGSIAIAAFNDSGFAQEMATGDAVAPLRLAPWGKIDGKLIIAGQAAGGRDILIQSMDAYEPTSGRFYKSSQTQTGADGTFHFDRVAPGAMQISRTARQTFPGGGYMNRPTQTETIDVKAGQTLTVQIGGVGRPVIGKLILPAGAGSIKNYMLNGNVNGTTSTATSEYPAQMPANIRNGSSAAQEIWMQFFRITPAGQQWSQSHPPPQPIQRQYWLELGEGNSFRIEDVVPGDYNVFINMNPMQGGRLLSQQLQFTMPPVPGGYSAEPLVLPDITLRQN